MARLQEVTVVPAQGGRLMTKPSIETPGITNYAHKLNWRRDLTDEMRREGHDYFVPNTNKPIGGQPLPGQRDVTEITRNGTTVTVTIGRGHHFESGETILIAGADQEEYNDEFTISNITGTTFDFTIDSEPITPATGAITACPIETINLVHQARRPNGQAAVIAGSERRLYRYFALENGDYVSTDPADYPAGQTALYWSTDPNDYPVGEIAEYVESDPGEWIVIGWGYKTWAQGAHRWEHDSINGWSIFNNGIDLPQSYRVEDSLAYPVYELREQGVSFVGTICELSGVQIAMDIAEIFTSKLAGVLGFLGTIDSGNLTAFQSGNTVTATSDFFDATWLGKYLIFEEDDTPRKIIAIANARTVTVDGPSASVDPAQTFTLRSKSYQTGATFSGMTTASVTQGSSTIESSAAFFDGSMIGKTFLFSNGYRRTIASVPDPTHVTWTPSSAEPVAYGDISGLPFWVISNPVFASADYIVTADDAMFTEDMVGKHLVFDTGDVRLIKGWINSSSVYVDTFSPLTLGFVSLENTDSYKPYPHNQYVNRIQYRKIWSLPDFPTRWGATALGTITAGSRDLTLAYPMKSFANGDEVVIQGAGTDGGNLTTTIVYISALGSKWLLADAAETAVADAPTVRSDTIGSILGFADLQDDSSAILKGLDLQGTLVIYKDTCIFLANFTGSPDTPFIYRRVKVPFAKNLYYRFTLILVQGLYHIYAGRNAFYRFDLTTRTPTEMPIFEAINNLFFDVATIQRTNEIFSADNANTNEVWIAIPGDTGGSAGTGEGGSVLCYDYAYETISTADIPVTGAATVKRPETGISIGETEDWFVFGNARGVVMVYGKAEERQPFWGDVRDIFYRRDTNPLDLAKDSYTSDLRGGLSHFGDPFNEKDLLEFVFYLASQSPHTPPIVEIYGARNTAEGATLLASRVFTDPESRNLFPLFFRKNYFQDRLLVHGQNNPFRLASRSWRGHGLTTRSIIRKP